MNEKLRLITDLIKEYIEENEDNVNLLFVAKTDDSEQAYFGFDMIEPDEFMSLVSLGTEKAMYAYENAALEVGEIGLFFTIFDDGLPFSYN